MSTVQTSPGPDADRAFRLGTIASAVALLATVGALYWTGIATLLAVVCVLVAVFPVYLVLVAAVLSVWLGYGKDATALRPVTVPKDIDE
jgi:hypothetical protein